MRKVGVQTRACNEVVYSKTYARKIVESGKLLEERSVKVECISIKLSVLISGNLAFFNIGLMNLLN